jgi:recombination protein RecA
MVKSTTTKRQPIKNEEDTKPKSEVGSELDEFERGLILDMNKEFDESSMILDDTDRGQVTIWVPSGNPDLDFKLGGGWPGGRIVEVYGPESNGKTTVALHAIAETQKLGGTAVFLDTEHALDKRRAAAIGVNLKKLIYAQPETMEELFEYVEVMIEKVKAKDPNRLLTIVWDSVAATPTKAELEGDYDAQSVMGQHARVMSQAFRKIKGLISKYKVLFMCINQIRDKMNAGHGEKTSTFGGRALKFYATIRLDVRRIEMYKEGGVIKGITCQATVKKNKVSAPFGVSQFNILFQDVDGGIDKYGALLEDGFEVGMFGNSKGWYEIDGKKYRMADARQYLKDNPDKYQSLVDTYMSVATL